MKDSDKSKEMSCLHYWDVNKLYSWAMPHKLPLNSFEGIKDTSQFNEDFIKNYNEEHYKGYFLEVDVQFVEKLRELHTYLPFYQKESKLKTSKNL